MNLKLKRLALPFAVLGAMVIPITVAAACGTTAARTAAPSEKAFEGKDTTIDNILTDLKSKEVTPVSANLMNEVKTLTGETLYEEEFIASKLLQQEYFAYSKMDLLERKWEVAKSVLAEATEVSTAVTSEQKIAEIARAFVIISRASNDNNTLKANKRTLDDYTKQQENLEKFITALATDITGGTPLNYNANNFSSQYPQIITPLQKIKDTQRRVYNEAKTAAINTYSTSSQGEAAWVTQRASRYGGAKTDDEAVNVLIARNIATIAFGRFTYAINSAFSVKQVLSGAFSQFRKIGDQYVFGPNGQGFFTKDVNNKDGKVYFLARNTKIAANIVVNPTDLTVGANKNAIDQFTAKNIIGVQHALVKVTAGKGDTLPWVVNKATIKNLLTYYGADASVGGKVFNLWKNIFQTDSNQTAKTEQDNTFLKFFSDNEAATKEKSGSLGIDAMNYWVENMDNNFAMGLVAARSQKLLATKYPATEVGYAGQTAGQALLNNLQAKLEATLDNLGLSQINDYSERNRVINQYIDNLVEADFQQKYGTIFRDIFSESKQLAYEINAAQGIYLVRSANNGLHIVKINEYGNADVLKTEIDRDLALIAEKDNVSAAAVQWANIFSKIYDNQIIVRELINDTSLMTKLKLNTTADFKAANPKKLAEWISSNYLLQNEDILGRVRSTIDNLDRNTVINAAVKALTTPKSGKTVVTSLIETLDTRFLADTINPETLYNAALEEMGVRTNG